MSDEKGPVKAKVKTKPKEQKGLILVFDLDNTLVMNHFLSPEDTGSLLQDIESLWQTYDINIFKSLNIECAQVLFEAMEAKKTGIVDSIFLITNNSDTIFINSVIDVLKVVFGTDKVFDAVLARNGLLSDDGEVVEASGRSARSQNPPKRMKDVRFLLTHIGKAVSASPSSQLNRRVFFLDDFAGHQICKEIPKENFIHIIPNPKGLFDLSFFHPQDSTNYEYVKERLAQKGADVSTVRRTRKHKHKRK
jgi:hypothetical protein